MNEPRAPEANPQIAFLVNEIRSPSFESMSENVLNKPNRAVA